MKENKQSNKIITLVSIIILLCLTLTVSVIYNYVGGFYYTRISSFNKLIGEEQTLEINEEGAYVCSFNFTGGLIINSDIKQEVYIKNGEKELFVRAKLCMDNKNCGIVFGFSNWLQSKDKYIYLNQALQPFDTVGLCKFLKFDEDISLDNSKDYIASIVVEASQTEFEFEVL